MTYRGILFIGPNNSGKSTQGKRLAHDSRMTYISSSEQLLAFRDAHPSDPRSAEIDEIFGQGSCLKTPKLLRDETLVSVIMERLGEIAASGSYDPGSGLAVLDGVIRTRAQASLFDESSEGELRVEHAIVFDVHDEELYCRWAGRKRPGETEAVFWDRLDIYKTHLPELDDFYRKRGVIAHVNAMGSPDEVSLRIGNLLN